METEMNPSSLLRKVFGIGTEVARRLTAEQGALLSRGGITQVDLSRPLDKHSKLCSCAFIRFRGCLFDQQDFLFN